MMRNFTCFICKARYVLEKLQPQPRFQWALFILKSGLNFTHFLAFSNLELIKHNDSRVFTNVPLFHSSCSFMRWSVVQWLQKLFSFQENTEHSALAYRRNRRTLPGNNQSLIHLFFFFLQTLTLSFILCSVFFYSNIMIDSSASFKNKTDTVYLIRTIILVLSFVFAEESCFTVKIPSMVIHLVHLCVWFNLSSNFSIISQETSWKGLCCFILIIWEEETVFCDYCHSTNLLDFVRKSQGMLHQI